MLVLAKFTNEATASLIETIFAFTCSLVLFLYFYLSAKEKEFRVRGVIVAKKENPSSYLLMQIATSFAAVVFFILGFQSIN